MPLSATASSAESAFRDFSTTFQNTLPPNLFRARNTISVREARMKRRGTFWAIRWRGCTTRAGTSTILKDEHPLNYYKRGNARAKMHNETADLLEEWLRMLADVGEKETFEYIKKLNKEAKKKK